MAHHPGVIAALDEHGNPVRLFKFTDLRMVDGTQFIDKYEVITLPNQDTVVLISDNDIDYCTKCIIL